MRWSEVQDHLATGHLASREGWSEEAYVELEADSLSIFTFAYPEGTPYHPGYEDVEAEDWTVVGVA